MYLVLELSRKPTKKEQTASICMRKRNGGVSVLNIHVFEFLKSSYGTDPVLLGGRGDLVQKVLVHKRPHGVVDDDHRPLALALAQGQDSVPYRPVASRPARHHSDLPVPKTLDDVRHQVRVVFGHDDHDALDPRHPAGKTHIFGSATGGRQGPPRAPSV